MSNCLPRRFLRLAAALAACAAGIAQQQPQSTTEAERRQYFLANYTKFEYRIPMRDGVRLFTNVYVPKDESRTTRSCSVVHHTVAPMASTTTPTWRRTWRSSSRRLHLRRSDVRGRIRPGRVRQRALHPRQERNEGRDETTDTYDSIEDGGNLPGNNGRVGMWGISYPGFYAAMGLIDAHPALKACSPQAPIADWFMGDDWRHNGALFLAHTLSFFTSFGRPWSEPGQTPAPAPFRPGTPDMNSSWTRPAET
jgi:predicted acyl esterase